jgi:hypothetical protein
LEEEAMSQGSDWGAADQQVVDFSEARAQKLDEKRRKTERIFFKKILGVYCVKSGNSSAMQPIELVEVSEEGCSFQIPYESRKNFSREETLTTRLYFSQDTYIPLMLKVVHSRPAVVDGARYQRFGCVVEPNSSTYDVYQQFVRFLKLYSEQAHRDMGEMSVFYL